MRRSDEEFVTEVFRRRDAYVQEKRAGRRRILMRSIPVVICAVLLCFMLPQGFRDKGVNNEAYIPEMDGVSPENAGQVKGEEDVPEDGTFSDLPNAEDEFSPAIGKIISIRVQVQDMMNGMGTESLQSWHVTEEKALVKLLNVLGEWERTPIQENAPDEVSGRYYQVTLYDEAGTMHSYRLEGNAFYVGEHFWACLTEEQIDNFEAILKTLDTEEY